MGWHTLLRVDQARQALKAHHHHRRAPRFGELEMCAPKNPHDINHSVFIEDMVLYVYNFDNPINDARVGAGREDQIKLDRYIRSLPSYEPLGEL